MYDKLRETIKQKKGEESQVILKRAAKEYEEVTRASYLAVIIRRGFIMAFINTARTESCIISAGNGI